MNKKSTPVKASFFPPDWPQDGPIDLTLHDLPHASSTTEWWYMHSHIEAGNERRFALFASFFRRIISYDKKSKLPVYGYSVLWGLSDLNKEDYHTVSLVDGRAPKLGLQRLNRGEIVKDPFIKRAAIEMLKKGVLPYPDELLKKEAYIALDKLHLDYDGNTFHKRDNGNYALHLHHDELNITVDVEFQPLKPPTRHGDNGVVRGVSAEDMFYYFIPRCKVGGELKVKDEKFEFTDASGWYRPRIWPLPGKRK